MSHLPCPYSLFTHPFHPLNPFFNYLHLPTTLSTLLAACDLFFLLPLIFQSRDTYSFLPPHLLTTPSLSRHTHCQSLFSPHHSLLISLMFIPPPPSAHFSRQKKKKKIYMNALRICSLYLCVPCLPLPCCNMRDEFLLIIAATCSFIKCLCSPYNVDRQSHISPPNPL